MPVMRLLERMAGDQTGEGFAGAGFDDEVFTVGESGLDGLGHFELAGAVLVIGVPRGKRRRGGKRTGARRALWWEWTFGAC